MEFPWGKMLKKIQNKTLKNRVENSEVSRVQLFIQSVAIFFLNFLFDFVCEESGLLSGGAVAL